MGVDVQSNHVELVRFVFEAADSIPKARRVRVYRGLAEVCGDVTVRTQLLELASALENAELACNEFPFPKSEPGKHFLS